MMNDTVRLKLLGYLPTIPLKELTAVHAHSAVDVENPILAGRTCGTPDFPDAEIANTTPRVLAAAIEEEEGLCECFISMHRKLLAATTGRGSFPPGCNPKYPTRHTATYHVDRDSFDAAHYHRQVTTTELSQAAVYFRISASEATARFGTLTMMNLALKMMDEAYRRVGIGLSEVADRAKANILILTRRLGSNIIGMAEFNDRTCLDVVRHWIDTNYRPSLMSFAHLLTHESGHNNNLEHEFQNQNVHRSVMSYAPKQPFVGFAKGESDRPDDASLPVLRRYYGDEPFPSPDVPPPGPELLPEFTGELTAEQGPNGTAIRGVIAVNFPVGLKPGTYRQIVVPGSAPGKFKFKPKNEV